MSMHPIDSLMFDVDGTIWDSTFVIARAWTKVLADHGYGSIILTADQLKHEFGKPLSDIADDLLPEIESQDRQKILDEWIIVQANCLQFDPPTLYDGLEATLQELSSRYQLFVISNAQVGYIENLFKVTGIGKYFVDHVCNGDTGLSKAGNITYIAEKYGLKHPAYIGDIQGDYLSTREAGVDFIYAAYGFGDVAEYEYRINCPADLLKIGL